MQVSIGCVLSKHDANAPLSVIHQSQGAVQYRSPQNLTERGFPCSEASLKCDSSYPLEGGAQGFVDSLLPDVVEDFLNRATNTVLYAHGPRGSNKLGFIFGGSSKGGGVLEVLMKKIFAQNISNFTIQVAGFNINNKDGIVDICDSSNQEVTLIDSVKEGPSVQNLSQLPIGSLKDAQEALKKVFGSIGTTFASTLDPPSQLEAFPSYDSSHTVFSIMKFPADSSIDSNSITIVILGDTERPALCGYDMEQLRAFENTHRTISAVAQMIVAIKGNRLRLPFNKTKLTSMLKKPYNQEKGNPFNETNQPTKSFFFSFIVMDSSQAEETAHTFSLLKRLTTPGASVSSNVSRDMMCDKWRLEQDIVELKEDLQIAKLAHDYKPCIVEQKEKEGAKERNILEEEAKKVNAIVKKREEAKAKAKAELKEKAQQEAQIIIEAEELKSNSNLKEIEVKLGQLQAENAELTAQRDKKIKEVDKQLEKIRRKKVEEEEKSASLKNELAELEQETAECKLQIEEKEKQLKLLLEDRAKGKEIIKKTREEQAHKLTQEKEGQKQQRLQWIQELTDTLKRVEEVAQSLKDEKSTLPPFYRKFITVDDSIFNDLHRLRAYVPYFVNEQGTVGHDKMKTAFEEWIEARRTIYSQLLDDVNGRKQELETRQSTLNQAIQQHKAKTRLSQRADADMKNRHLARLREQVMEYLALGTRVWKIPSKGAPHKKFYFLEAIQSPQPGPFQYRIQGCDADDSGAAINKKKPSSSILIKEVERVVLGQYTDAFGQFARVRRPSPEDALQEPPQGATPIPQPDNIGRYFYRSFSIILKKGKTIDLVAESDSDFEAWVCGFQRVMKDTPVDWGQPLDISKRNKFADLSPAEVEFCRQNHVPPSQFLSVTKEIEKKSKEGFVTIFHIRTLAVLDLLRSTQLHEYLVNNGTIEPLPASA